MFLTIITRCCLRPKMLAKNLSSVLAQTDCDLEVIFIPDFHRRGVRWANAQFMANIHRIDGEYVYLLDDDCFLRDKRFVANLKKLVGKTRPAVIMVRAYRPQMAPNVLPKDRVWGKRQNLKVATANGGCFVIRSDLWKATASNYNKPGSGDWSYLGPLVNRKGVDFVWGNFFGCESMQLGRGVKFENCGKDWFSGIVKRFGIIQVAEGDWRLQLWKKR